MTRNTQRYNIKRLRIVWMMILLCLFTARTVKSFNRMQFTELNSLLNGIVGFKSVGVFSSLFGSFLPMSSFTLFGLIVSFLVSFALVAFSVSFVASFALGLQAVFCRTVLTKFRNRFNFLAIVASFCFNSFRHGFLQHRKLCLRAGCRLRPAVGLFYYNRKVGIVK